MPQHASPEPLISVTQRTDTTIAARLSAELPQSGPPIRVVFFDEEVAALWRESEQIDALAWGAPLARRLLLATPPMPLDRVAPPPIVVGDGPLAGVLLTELVAGFSAPGHPLVVHCLGWDESWAQAGAAWAGGSAQVSWSQVPLRSSSVIGVINTLLASWQPPPPNRGTCTGPSVYIACQDEATSAVIAQAISQQLPESRVAMPTSGDIAWPNESVTRTSRDDTVAVVLDGKTTPTLLLARLLFDDLAWLNAEDSGATAHCEPILPLPNPKESHWDHQDENTVATYLHVAENLTAILKAGQVEVSTLSRQPHSIILTPNELSAMAERLLKLTGWDRSQGRWQAAVEIAARLPLLASRAGYTLRRPKDYKPLLRPELIDDLATQIHWAYLSIAAQTSNATGSPLAGALWEDLSDYDKASNRAVITGSTVTCTVAGLTWKSSVTATTSPVTQDQLNYLGELEHRRWAIFSRGCGRPDHKYQLPWESLKPDEQFYDIEIMRQLPVILAEAGIAIEQV